VRVIYCCFSERLRWGWLAPAPVRGSQEGGGAHTEKLGKRKVGSSSALRPYEHGPCFAPPDLVALGVHSKMGGVFSLTKNEGFLRVISGGPRPRAGGVSLPLPTNQNLSLWGGVPVVFLFLRTKRQFDFGPPGGQLVVGGCSLARSKGGTTYSLDGTDAPEKILFLDRKTSNSYGINTKSTA